MEVHVRNKLTGDYGMVTISEGEEVREVKAKVAKALDMEDEMFVLEVGGVVVMEGGVVVGAGEEVSVLPSKKLEAKMYFEAKGVPPNMASAAHDCNLAEIEHCYNLDPAAGDEVIHSFIPTPAAELLLSLGTSPLCANTQGHNMAHIAVANDSTDLLRLALEHGCRPTDRASDGTTVLHIAATRPSVALRYLLARHTGTLPTDNTGATLLHSAASFANEVNATLLIEEYNHAVHPLDNKKHAPLHYAASTGDINLCTYLLSKGASVKQTHKYKSTPLHFAAQSGHPGIISLFVAHGAELDVVDRTGKTPLLRACIGALTLDSVGALLEAGSDVNAADQAGDTALSLVLGCGADLALRDEVATVLLEKGAKVDTANRKKGLTPLHHAAGLPGLVRVMEQLLERGADANAVSSVRATPLHHACRAGNVEGVQVLCQHEGINFTALDKAGNTPLHVAVATEGTAIPACIVSACPAAKEVLNAAGATPHAVALAAHPETTDLHDLLKLT